jgi:hypothetical protein
MQQHMLFLFFPLKKGALAQAMGAIGGVTASAKAAADSTADTGADTDERAATGVHFAMFTGLPADMKPDFPVPCFQTAPGKDLLIIQSIYDADFTPYIAAFTSHESVAQALDGVLSLMDETGIVEPSDPTSAAWILANKGVFKNPNAFVDLLMRYNYSDPTIPATTGAGVSPVQNPKLVLLATFPGLTVGQILQTGDLGATYPYPPVPIQYDSSAPPMK